MAKKTTAFAQEYAFYEQLWTFYVENRGKIRSRYNDLTRKFLAYNDGKILNVLVKDIMYIQIQKHYAYYYLEDKVLCERNTMAALTDNFKLSRFIQIMRNTIVNFGYIDTIKDKVILKNGEKLNYSDRKYHDILNKYLYLSRRNQI